MSQSYRLTTRSFQIKLQNLIVRPATAQKISILVWWAITVHPVMLLPSGLFLSFSTHRYFLSTVPNATRLRPATIWCTSKWFLKKLPLGAMREETVVAKLFWLVNVILAIKQLLGMTFREWVFINTIKTVWLSHQRVNYHYKSKYKHPSSHHQPFVASIKPEYDGAWVDVDKFVPNSWSTCKMEIKWSISAISSKTRQLRV